MPRIIVTHVERIDFLMSDIGLPAKQLFRPAEAARYIGVHVETIRRWIREGKIKSVRTIGGHNRIYRGDILRIMETKRDD